MNAIAYNIPMALIPHPQGPWLEGITPVTNLQWQAGVEPLMGQGAKYCLLEPDYRGDLMARQFGNLWDVLDTLGRDNVPESWNGREVVEREIPDRGALAFFRWFPKMSRSGFDGDHQPVVEVSWYHAKGWTLAQGGLYLLSDVQWEWSAQGGERGLKYATETGKLTGPKGKKLAHCSIGTDEESTIGINDPRYADGPFGLRHKTGNVWEWTERNPNKKYQYGRRGGSWGNADPELLRAAYRSGDNPGNCDDYISFRVGAPARGP
jgi:formylglycine-generating enzyme required for sulfatase activity